MTLYSLRSRPDTYAITKFTDDLEAEATYTVSPEGCSCPAGHRPSCRHRDMLPKLRPHADTSAFYHWERDTIVHPLTPEPG